MAASVPDEAFARIAQQAGVVTFDELEAARATQAENARRGLAASLPDVLLQQGVITAKQRETVEKRLLAEQQGGLQQLGPYKLLEKLGQGGMGAVYLADDTSVGRKVAVKILAKKYSEDRELLTRFRREAQATGKLNHVNIVMAYNVAEEGGTHYYAMEYCDGETLEKILKRDKVIPWDTAVAVVLQVARGLKHAHDHGIIHRDIKPANIFICKPLGGTGVPPVTAQSTGETPVLRESFVAKILDLGLSKNISGQEQSFYTQTGVALGTPHYIAPEQAKGEKGIDGRTDIYSLGATFYHLITGQTPFTGSTAAIVMMKHLSEELPNPQDIVLDIPEGVVQVIMKMMAKEPRDRYPTCKELLDDLERVIDGKMPGSQAIDVGKSSVAVARRFPLPSRERGERAKRERGEGAPPSSGAEAPPSPHRGEGRGTRRHEPVGERRQGERRVEETVELVPLEEVTPAPPSRMPLYIGAGVAALGLLIFVLALVFSNKSEIRNSKSETNGETEIAKPDTGSQQQTEAARGTQAAVVPPQTTNPKPETTKAGADARGTEKGVTDAWIKRVQGLGAEEQVKKVMEKMPEVNPAIWKVLETHKIENGKVTELTLSTPGVEDISPLRALKHLQVLNMGDCRVSDLSPLSELSLTALDVRKTQVSDLAPLKRMPLVRLNCSDTKVADLSPLAGKLLRNLGVRRTAVSDLSPLKNMPLRELDCLGTPVSDIRPLTGMSFSDLNLRFTKVTDFDPLAGATIRWEFYCDSPELHLDALRKVKILRTINDIPVAEFWKKYPETGKQPDTGTGGRGDAEKERAWKAIFDGKTTECLGEMTKDVWRVEDGAIANSLAWGDIWAETRKLLGDGEARVRFEVAGCSYLQFNRMGGGGNYRVIIPKRDLDPLAGKVNELVFTCRGEDVDAKLNGQPVAVETASRGREGRVRFLANGGTLRVLSIEYRELAPERLEVGQKDKDGWVCIFNGKDLTGWRAFGGKPPVEDGALVLADYAVVRRAASANFELRGEVKLVKGGDAQYCGGFSLRVPNNPSVDPRISMFADGDVHIYHRGAKFLAQLGTGRAPLQRWLPFVLRAVGPSITFNVGDKTISAQVEVLEKGDVSLNGRGRIEFKDLWLRELGPDGKPLGAGGGGK